MWGGVILPEGTQIADLPAFHRFARGFVTGVRGELVGQSPTADAGAVSFEVEATMQFAGRGAVGRGRLGGQEFGEQGNHRSGPFWAMVAAGLNR